MSGTIDSTLPRRSGIRLDTERIDYEIARRAITQRALAACAGIPPLTMSRARRGYPISEQTLKRISQALLKIPLAVGADSLLAEPQKKTVSTRSLAETVPPTREDHGHGRPAS